MNASAPASGPIVVREIVRWLRAVLMGTLAMFGLPFLAGGLIAANQKAGAVPTIAVWVTCIVVLGFMVLAWRSLTGRWLLDGQTLRVRGWRGERVIAFDEIVNNSETYREGHESDQHRLRLELADGTVITTRLAGVARWPGWSQFVAAFGGHRLNTLRSAKGVQIGAVSTTDTGLVVGGESFPWVALLTLKRDRSQMVFVLDNGKEPSLGLDGLTDRIAILALVQQHRPDIAVIR